MNEDTPYTFGSHLILDVWGGRPLDDIEYIDSALHAMVETAEATLIKVVLHHFGPGSGVTGVAILAESHISIHTWPEHQYAAFDIFMCGTADVNKVIPVIEQLFTPERIEQVSLRRGSLQGK